MNCYLAKSQIDIYLPKVPQHLVILMTAYNHNLPLSKENHKRFICTLLCDSQKLDARRADYQSWQSQSSTIDSTQAEERACLPVKHHGLASEQVLRVRYRFHTLPSEASAKRSIY